MNHLALLVLLAACGEVRVSDLPDAGGGSSEPQPPPPAVDAAMPDAIQPVLGCDQAPVIPGTGTITSWSRLIGQVSVNYFGDGIHAVDITKFTAIFSNPMYPKPAWPAGYDTNAAIPIPTNRYVSAEFTVPADYFATNPTGLFGLYSIGESAFSAAVALSISEHCGDFGQLSPTTVVPGCLANKLNADGSLEWRDGPGDCQLVPGKRYYLNVINADVSAFPAKTTLRTQYCVGNVCTTPVANGYGNWTD